MKQELFPEIADSGLRIDKYLSTVNEQLSRSYIQKMLKSGLVLVDGKPVKASYQVEEGEVISLDIPEAVEPEIEPEDMDLDILYEETESLFKRSVASKEICELRNMINVGYLIMRMAMERKESRGLHYTVDYPHAGK